MGEGADVLLIHGLGGAKSSFFDTAAASRATTASTRSTCRASAAHPSRRRRPTTRALVRRDGQSRRWTRSASSARTSSGNSIGGRVALELGLRAPERVAGLALLCPAVAFVKRGLAPARAAAAPRARRAAAPVHPRDGRGPLLGAVRRPATTSTRRWPTSSSTSSSASYASAGARIAFLAAARNIYLDEPVRARRLLPAPRPSSRRPRCSSGARTTSSSRPAFRHHVEQWLPGAEQIVFEGCGHVPQVERPEQINGAARAASSRASTPSGRRTGAARRASRAAA